MKKIPTTIAVLIALLAGCSDPVSQHPAAPFASRDFDPRLGNVQITRIYYDEEANNKEDGTLNEFVVLQSNDTVVMNRWVLDAGQGVPLPINDTLFKSRTFYTQSQAGVPNHFASTFGYALWIWSEHDTAKLYDTKHNLVSALIY